MRTVRPLDYENSVLSISGRLQRNSLGSAANADADGNRFNVSYIGQSADRKVGFVIGYSHSDTPIQENQVGLYEHGMGNPMRSPSGSARETRF